MNKIPVTICVAILFCFNNLSVAASAGLEILTLGTAPSLTAVLEIIADEMGFFRAEGLSVMIREYPSGQEALDDVLARRVDMAASTSLPIVAQSFKRADFRVIGTVGDLANDNVVVARRNAGIANVSDLKGKRVGTTANIMPHYMLDLLLRKHGLGSNEVQLVFAPQSQLVEALAKGRLDAAALLGGYISKARLALATNASVFSDQTLFEIKSYVMVHEHLVGLRPLAIEKFLRGCIRAEQYAASDPENSMKIVARRLKLDIAEVRQSWPECHFAVEFHQAMLNDLESKAQWQLERSRAHQRVPNYLKYFYYQGLETIEPRRVTVIH
jgi:ABC-type nitrate/sulfonate/bicarbonate transport system substrate-binding protein